MKRSPHCRLESPTDAESWSAYHQIRRKILFENRGLVGTYDPDHPDERKPGNYPKLLVCDSEHVGVVRIDLTGDTAQLRRVAIDQSWQRRGLGRELIRLAEQFAIEHGARNLEASVAADAVGFYEKCGYRPMPLERVAGANVRMHKVLADAEQRVAPHGGPRGRRRVRSSP